MSAAVGENSTKNWQGSRRTHLFSREWGREIWIEWRGNEEVCYEDLELAGGWAVSMDCWWVSATCFFPQHPTSVRDRQRQPFRHQQGWLCLGVRQYVCVNHSPV